MSIIAFEALKGHLEITPLNLDGFPANQGISHLLSS